MKSLNKQQPMESFLGTVLRSTGSWYEVLHEGERYQCRIRGKLRLKGIRSTTPVVVGEKNPNYNLVLEEIADDLRSELTYADEAFSLGECGFEGGKQVVTMTRMRDGYPYRLRLDLLGEYQRKNLVTVATVLDRLHESTPLSISRRAFVEGVREVSQLTSFRGRWQVLSDKPLVVCDTAHNEHGIAEVANRTFVGV